MCGILVVAQTDSSPSLDEALIIAMRDALAHRGPDDATVESIDTWVALAHRRLSVIDIEGAPQPLRSADGQVVVIFNGEIYNYVELRSRLRSLGHTFTTDGDGEVIVHGFAEWGTGVFAMLEGMFSIALVDRKASRLFLARDRFGIKPLFYRRDAGVLSAASELKALVVGGVSPVASRLALSLGALRMHVPWPLTAFDGIFRLPPGSVLELERGGRTSLSRFAPMVDASHASSDSSPAAALAALESAVARQMVADVPVGAFLSGGIDSTLIVALMRRLTSNQIHTFSVGTLEHDESSVAAVTAKALGTKHHRIDLEQISFDDLAALPALYDEPFAETSALGVRALSRYAREHVTVALSGDGGDEIFGGYGSYRWINSLATLPRAGRSAAASAAHRLLVARRWPELVRRGLRAALLFGATPSTAQRDVSSLSWAADVETRRDSEALSERIREVCGTGLSHLDAARTAMAADRLERLPNAMLAKVDIASMSASLEVRVPMLDDALVRYADGLPLSSLLDRKHGKLLLRQVLQDLPGGDSVAWASKRGFSLPLDVWMKQTPIQARLGELLGDNRDRLEELTGDDVGPLWSAFRNDRSRFSQGTAAMQLLWFANVALWAERFGVRSSRESRVRDLPIA